MLAHSIWWQARCVQTMPALTACGWVYRFPKHAHASTFTRRATVVQSRLTGVRRADHGSPQHVACLLQVQYCTACRLVTPKQVVSGRLEVLSSADRRSCLHFAGEPVPEDADGEVESAASASKVQLRFWNPALLWLRLAIGGLWAVVGNAVSLHGSYMVRFCWHRNLATVAATALEVSYLCASRHAVAACSQEHNPGFCGRRPSARR